MKNFVKDWKDPNSVSPLCAKKWRLNDELSEAGYFIGRALPYGWAMYRYTQSNEVYWNRTLKQMDGYITWKKDTLLEETV